MILFFDTSFLIEIDQKNPKAIKLAENVVKQGHKLYISTITVSEFLTGPYLRNDTDKSLLNAKDLLNQFKWFSFEGMTANKTAELTSHLIKKGQKMEFQDIAIAATALIIGVDYIITENKAHFERILKDKTLTIEEALKIFK